MIQHFKFGNPEFLWLLLLLFPLGAFYFFYGKKEYPSLSLSNAISFKTYASFWSKFRPILYFLRLLSIGLLILALARPQLESISSKVKKTKGIDIVMAIDISASMLSKDLKPNRLEALKKVAKDFVLKRPNDRIGVVVYSGESYTRIPLTTDKAIVEKSIKDISYNFGELEGGTAIGLGLATAVNRLKTSKAKSKIIILLTDGDNNAGFIDPKTSAEIAYEYGIKAYTIGIGTNGRALSPVSYSVTQKRLEYDMREVKIDESLLRYIAKRTGGEYFRATNNEKLQGIYDKINKLEKTDIEELKFYGHEEYYRYTSVLAGFLVFLEMILRYTIFKSSI